jgi:PII-like signaling protein
MRTGQPAKILRLHFSEHDRVEGRPLHEVIVEKCRQMGIAGATVFRGLEGYGESAHIHRHHLLTHELPIVVTIIDSDENVRRLIPVVEGLLDTGLIAISDVEVFRIQNSPTDQDI